MAKLFVDTWGWLTLHDKSEAKHQEVVTFYRSFRNQNGLIYTTDYVLDETFTLFFKRLPAFQAQSSMDMLTQAFLLKGFHLVRVTAERFSKTQALRSKFLDKPQISFTDLTSMVVMSELGIETVLTAMLILFKSAWDSNEFRKAKPIAWLLFNLVSKYPKR